jgi:hypothetical protein
MLPRRKRLFDPGKNELPVDKASAIPDKTLEELFNLGKKYGKIL